MCRRADVGQLSSFIVLLYHVRLCNNELSPKCELKHVKADLNWDVTLSNKHRLQNKDEGQLTTTSLSDGALSHCVTTPLWHHTCRLSHMNEASNFNRRVLLSLNSFQTIFWHHSENERRTKTIRSTDPKEPSWNVSFLSGQPTKLSTADDQVPGCILLSNSWAPVMWKPIKYVLEQLELLPKHQNYFKFSNSGNESSFLNVSIQAVHLKWKLDVLGQWRL